MYLVVAIVRDKEGSVVRADCYVHGLKQNGVTGAGVAAGAIPCQKQGSGVISAVVSVGWYQPHTAHSATGVGARRLSDL